jgi:DNA-binding SARP family transcriptional activator
MPSHRNGPDHEIEAHQPDEARLMPPTPQPGSLPTSQAAAASSATSEVPPAVCCVTSPTVVAATPLDPEPLPLRWPGSVPSTVPAGHLEDPQWTRVLVAIAAGSASDGELPLAWRFGPVDAAAFLQTAASPPQPFGPHICGAGWSITKDPRLADLVTPADVNRASTRSGLVTMWHDDASRCLLDMVAARSVALEGPPVAVGYTLSDIVVELASRRWSDVGALYLVGFGREMHGLENVRYIPTVGDASALLSGEPTSEEGARCFVVAPLRTSETGEAELRRLLRLVEQTPATGVICCDTAVGAQCTWHLAAHRQTLRMELRGRAGPAFVLTPEHWVEQTGVAMRLAPRSVTGFAPLPGTLRAPVPDVALKVAPRARASGVDVLVLGPVQVEGANESFEARPLLTELVVYLAFHPEGLAGEACATALWPDKRVPLQTLSNRLHEARRALGTMEDGRARLKRSDGRHMLAPDVRTDWSRFVALTGPESGPASWRQALAVVRGRPFDGLAKGDWAVFEGFVAAIEAAVVGVAARLGEHLLEAADPLGAEWALRQGLLVAPWDERLYRLLMVAADATGNRGGVESVLRSLAQVLDHPGDPIGAVHAETAALYRRLTGARRPKESPEAP